MVLSARFSSLKESGIFWKIIVLLYISVGAAFTIYGFSRAATVRTVCDSGCDYTTVGSAITESQFGDTVRVTGTYTGVAESPFIVFGNLNVILECIDGPTIGNSGATTTIAISGNSTIQNCSFRKTAITTTGLNPEGITFTGNTFTTDEYSSIDFGSSLGMVVSNNINIRKIFIETVGVVDPTVTGNTFYVTSPDVLSASAGSTSLTITNNTFIGHAEIPESQEMIKISHGGLGGNFDNVVFATNTIEAKVTQNAVAYSAVNITFSNSLIFSGNQIDLERGVALGAELSGTNGSVAHIQNNTIRFRHDYVAEYVGASAIVYTQSGTGSVDLSYNLIWYNETGAISDRGFVIQALDFATLTIANDYNGFWSENASFGFIGSRMKCDTYGSGTINGCTEGAHTKVDSDPHFRIENLSTMDDLYLAPFSDYLDVNGEQDIGAHSGARRSNIYVDASATAASIDYSTIDKADIFSLISLSGHLRSGDVIHVASGSYDFTGFSSSMISSGLSIQGAGSGSTFFNVIPGDGGATLYDITNLVLSGVTIRANANSNTLTLINSSSSVFSNVVFENASSTTSTYYASVPQYSYLGNLYNQGNLVGGTSTSTMMLTDGACGVDSNWNTTGNVTSYLNGVSDVNIALIHVPSMGNARITVLVPNNYAANSGVFEGQCGGIIVVDQWVSGAFAVSNNIYTYNAAAVNTAGLTISPLSENPPHIDRIIGYAGVKLVNSSNNIFSVVTSTANGYGFWFDGISSLNIVQDSYLGSNADADVFASGSGEYNSIKNTTFSHSLINILGTTVLKIYQKIYITVRDSFNTPIGGASVSLSSANAVVSGTLETLNTGTTVLSTNLLTSIFSSSGHIDTMGGYNPYTFSISATSTFLATSTAISLISPNQNIDVYLSTSTSEVAVVDTPPIGSSAPSVAPSISSFLINGGMLKTASSTVNIILNAADAATMVVSEDINFVGQSTTAFLASFVARLSQTPGIKTLYAKVFNAQGTASDVVSSTIQYDPVSTSTSTPQVIPTGSVVFTGSLIGGATSSTNVGLSFTYDSNVTEMKVGALADLTGSVWESVAAAIPWTVSAGDGTKRVYVKFRTATGIESAVYASSIRLDQTGPAEPQFIGAIEKGNFTEQPTIISGTADANTAVRITLIKGGKTIASFENTSSGAGVWSVSAPKLSVGRYVLNVRAYDALGNASSVASTYFDITAVTEVVPPDKKVIVQPPPETSTTPPDAPLPVGDKTVGSVGGSDQNAGSPPPGLGSTTSTALTPLDASAPLPIIDVPSTVIDATSTSLIVERVSEQVTAATTEVTKAVSASVKRASRVVIAVQNSPEVQTVNQVVVVPTVAVAAAASVGSAVNGIQAINYLKFLFTQPFFLLARKRRKGWGTVYNAITKMPMDLATVHLIDAQTGRVVRSQVTDKLGRYQFLAKPGDFKLDVVKPEYQFPATYLKGATEDGKFTDLYTGDVIHPVSAATISYNTPLDPIGVEKTGDELIKLARKKKVAEVVGNLGLIATAISFVVSPTPLVGGFLIVHVVSHFMFKRLATVKKPETWGVVSDSSGKPLENAIVRVFDKQYNKLLETQITDDKGRYAFLVGKNDYYLMIEKPGYEKVITEAISVPESEGGSVLAKNVQILSTPLTV